MTSYYLLDHPNPNCPERGDGRYWGYMEMQAVPRLITGHTAENFMDLITPDTGAEAVANYFATSNRAASYHTLIDSDSTVDCLPAGLDGTIPHTAFHCYGRNTGNLGWSIAMRSAEWATAPEWYKNSVLDKAAKVTAKWCVRWQIPPRLLTYHEAVTLGMSGITGHGIIQPEDRTDPGALFPWAEYLDRVYDALGNTPTKGEDMPDLLMQDKDGTIFGAFSNGNVRIMLGPEVSHWRSKGVDQILLDTDWTRYMQENVVVTRPGV